jgi:hypothetical protein
MTVYASKMTDHDNVWSTPIDGRHKTGIRFYFHIYKYAATSVVDEVCI